MMEYGANCTQPTIEEFPNWLTALPPRYDLVGIAFVISLYLFMALTIVSEHYLIPAVEVLCLSLHISCDVAGSTFLSAATSMPEFFVQCVGTFISKGDIGIGTVVGSAVFNLLAVPACCGLFSTVTIYLDWWPISRDIMWYLVSVAVLTWIIADGIVHWYEATFMLILFILNWAHHFKDHKLQKLFRKADPPTFPGVEMSEVFERLLPLEIEENSSEMQNHLTGFPKDGDIWRKAIWLLAWPLHLLFLITIPDVREVESRNYYWITLIVSTIWLSILCYLLTWMITVIGFNLFVPDSVMGITFLAAGLSIPEMVTSLIVTYKGYGSMAITNAISSNTFDILICLGLPWLFASGTKMNVVEIKSEGLAYSIGSLSLSAINMYLAFWISRFSLGRKVGFLCLIAYIFYILFASLIEMNVFGMINLPMCQINS